MGSMCAKDDDRLDHDESYSWMNSQGPNSGRSGRSSLNTNEMKNAALSNGGESYFSVDRKNLSSSRLNEYYSIVINPNPNKQDAPPKSMLQSTMNKMARQAADTLLTHYNNNKIAENQNIFNYGTFGPVFYDDGSTYTGQFKRGQKNGYGEMVYIDGSVYRGMWKDDQKSGYGILAFFDGDYYKGNFEQDKANGIGILIFFLNFFRCLFGFKKRGNL